MTSDEKLELLIEQAAELPDDAQAELVRSLVEMRFGVYNDEQSTALS